MTQETIKIIDTLHWRVELASKEEPYWHLTDNKGYRHRYHLAFFKTVTEDNLQARTFIIGRLKIAKIKDLLGRIK